jgi:hypothetical protein
MPELEKMENEPAIVPKSDCAFLYYTEVAGTYKLMAKLPDGSVVELV